MNLYVGQLPFHVSDQDLIDLFSPFGEVAGTNLVKDHFTGRFKGFAFIDMPDNAAADKAIKALNRSMFKGQEIKVNQAEQRKSKGRGRRRRHRS